MKTIGNLLLLSAGVLGAVGCTTTGRTNQIYTNGGALISLNGATPKIRAAGRVMYILGNSGTAYESDRYRNSRYNNKRILCVKERLAVCDLMDKIKAIRAGN